MKRKRLDAVTCAKCGHILDPEAYMAYPTRDTPPEQITVIVDPQYAPLSVQCSTCGHFTQYIPHERKRPLDTSSSIPAADVLRKLAKHVARGGENSFEVSTPPPLAPDILMPHSRSCTIQAVAPELIVQLDDCEATLEAWKKEEMIFGYSPVSGNAHAFGLTDNAMAKYA